MPATTDRRTEILEAFKTIKQPYEAWTTYEDSAKELANLGLTHADVPVLCELVRGYPDVEWGEDGYDQYAASAPILAARSLAVLKAMEGLPAIFDILPVMDDVMDMMHTEPDHMGATLAAFGSDAIDTLVRHIEDTEGGWSCLPAIHAIELLAKGDDALRARCIEVFCDCLNRHDANAPSINGTIVASLLNLKATEAAEVIERAYAAECVELMSCGNWNAVRDELGVEGWGLVPAGVASRDIHEGTAFGALAADYRALSNAWGARNLPSENASRKVRKSTVTAVSGEKRKKLDGKRRVRRRKSR